MTGVVSEPIHGTYFQEREVPVTFVYVQVYAEKRRTKQERSTK